MAIEVYNFIWTMCDPFPQEVPVEHQQLNVVNRPIKPTAGVILFPALLTPLVHVQDSTDGTFELLVATKDELTAEMVNHQLKISRGLQPWKPYRVQTMFGGVSGAGTDSPIQVKHVGEVDDDEEKILKAGASFSGVLQRDFAKALEDEGCTKVYRVLIGNAKGCLASACDAMRPSVAEIVKSFGDTNGNDGIKYCCTKDVPVPAAEKYRQRKLAEDDRDIVGLELHDSLIAKMTRRRFEKDGTRHLPPGGGLYCFAVEADDVDPNHFDGKAPIQSYHPAYVFSDSDAFAYANIGHLSDVHVNSRWRILKKSPARVIEGETNHSASIGELMSDNNRSFVSVLTKLVARDSQLIIVGGDIVDHIRNAHWDDPVEKPNAGDVWYAMNMDEDNGGYTMSNYPAGVDLVAFYSLILQKACSSKPVFVVTGNHDCYYEAFGITPRIKLKGRGNPGIPADLNLTMYEALLGFGASGAFLAELDMPFSPPWFEWFYTVLTPFRDYSHQLPKQTLVAFGWGYGEDVFFDLTGQGIGHLGRSKDAFTDPQLELLKAAVGYEATHRVILTTHFTIASFRDDVPNFFPADKNNKGKLNTSDGSGPRNIYDWGTFQKGHEPIHALLGQHPMTVVTGHTHRRGLYRIVEKDGDGLTVELHVAPVDGLAVKSADPGACIVVSDSAGPYPRSNRQGEFLGWGSDIPAGTLVETDKTTGLVSRVVPVRAARSKPRAVVAVNYVDLLEREAFAETHGIPDEAFMMIAIVKSRKAVAKRRYIYMPLGPKLAMMGVRAAELALVSLAKERTVRAPAKRAMTSSNFEFEVDESFDHELTRWLEATPSGQRFVSVKLELDASRVSAELAAHLSSQYSWDDWWHFDVGVDQESPDQYNDVITPPRPYQEASVDWYSVARVKRGLAVKGSGWFGKASYDDVPDWAWREQNFPDVYRRHGAPPPRPSTGRRPRRVS